MWKLRPTIVTAHDALSNAMAIKTHLLDLATTHSYPSAIGDDAVEAFNMTIFNLIDKHGGQGELGQWLTYCLDQAQSPAVPILSEATTQAAPGKPPPAFKASKSKQFDYSIRPAETMTQWKQRIRLQQLAVKGNTVIGASELDELSYISDEHAPFYAKNDSIPTAYLKRHADLIDREKISIKDYYIRPPSTSSSSSPTPTDMQHQGGVRVKYVWYDYHKQCGHGKVESIKNLYSAVKSVFEKGDALFVYTGMLHWPLCL